jgi:N-acetyl-1-D-myo-inositol-2-amino-2-deoxy-alpha-D-glucopyranoside deacetylase
MTAPAAARRLLLVHAHPDDETITTGATMAHYAAQGVAVTLLTCTLGEEGEILVPELAQLEAAQADQLGGVRIGELDTAMAALGVADHRFLGGAGRFRDSGMAGTPANAHPRAFWQADTRAEVFAAAVAAAVDVVREVRPQVVVTYDDNGDYGHPDHVMAHRVATAAVARAAEPGYGTGEPWTVDKFYWTATPRSVLRDDRAAVAQRSDLPFTPADPDELDLGVDDGVVTTVIDAAGCTAAKRAALAAHRTQVVVAEEFFAVSNLRGRRIRAVEHFRLVGGRLAAQRGAEELESDLFEGVAR